MKSRRCEDLAGRMVLVGAAVLPHGDFAYDPTLLSVPRVGNWTAAEQLHRGSEAAGAVIASLAPDAIVLVTPHGLEREDLARVPEFHHPHDSEGGHDKVRKTDDG